MFFRSGNGTTTMSRFLLTLIGVEPEPRARESGIGYD